MSTAEILSLISVVSFVLCGIAFVLAVFFWFFFKIPAVIGDLSGRTARKSIEKMRAGNEKAAQGYRPKTAYTTRNQPAPIAPQPLKPVAVNLQTQKPATVRLRKPAENPAEPEQMPETCLLDDGRAPTEDIQATELLREDMVPAEDIQATELLNDYNNLTEEIPATELLASTAITESLLDEDEKVTLIPTNGVMMTILDDVMLINTNESIP